MTINQITTFLAWSTVLNFAVMFFWWLILAVARDFIFKIHTKWFKLDDVTFDKMHYKGMVIYEVLILMFNLVPYLVLRIFVL